MKIILFQPQIPQNTGNIVRTCSVTGAGLILVRPLGFSTQSRHLKRAGLDYWEGVQVQEIDDLDSYLEETEDPFFFFSSKVPASYTTAPFSMNSLLIFGSETTGLPSKYFEKWPEKFFTIPMIAGSRCLNLATSAGVVLFEALRQIKI
ncbi:MAG: tRNA (cytidine(34)-2'-O)-methyltransferase [Parachlamydiales bacterium]|nr:tRNA (cytidine(34)-2'-O)-methyltransferase [Parachlamydiales bacterium]